MFLRRISTLESRKGFLMILISQSIALSQFSCRDRIYRYRIPIFEISQITAPSLPEE